MLPVTLGPVAAFHDSGCFLAVDFLFEVSRWSKEWIDWRVRRSFGDYLASLSGIIWDLLWEIPNQNFRVQPPRLCLLSFW